MKLVVEYTPTNSDTDCGKIQRIQSAEAEYRRQLNAFRRRNRRRDERTCQGRTE